MALSLLEQTPNWSKFLLGVLHQYQQSGLYCDAIVKATDSTPTPTPTRVHMCVFAAACPLLYPVISRKGSKFVVQVPLAAADLKSVVEYIYTGELVNGPDYATSRAFQELGLSYLPSSEWSSFLSSRLQQFQNGRYLCDVSLVASGGDVLTAHSCILSATSMLFESLIPGKEPCSITMKTSISTSTLEFMLSYLYTGRMDNLATYLQETADVGMELGFAYQEFMFSKGARETFTGTGTVSVALPDQAAENPTTKALAGSNSLSRDGEFRLDTAESGQTQSETDASKSLNKAPIEIDLDSDAFDAFDSPEVEEWSEPSETPSKRPKRTRGRKPRGKQNKAMSKPVKRGRGRKTKAKEQKEAVAKSSPIMFACSFCSKVLRNAVQLEEHERSHTGIKPFVCEQCAKAFSTAKALKIHQKLHNTDGTSHDCDTCGKKFASDAGLRRHMRRHGDKTLYICKLCGKALGDSTGLRIHEEVHAGIKPLLCQFCGKGFHGRGNLHTHERIHTGEKPFVCRFCGKAFNVRCTMRRHERIHTGDKPYSCPICNKAFTQLSTMKIHEMTHLGAKPHVCEVCNKDFVQLWDLKKHERIHSGVKPYKCDACQKCFRDLSHLKRHQKTFDGTCSWAAVRTERKGPPYICQICNKNFSKYCNLSRHRLIHTGEKPFNCAECGKCFRQQSTLRTHEKTHLDKAEKAHYPLPEAYMCPLCKKVFNKLSVFRKHEQMHREVDGLEEGEGIYMNAMVGPQPV